MKKVIILLPSLQQGGVVRSLLEAMRAVDTQAYQIVIYTYRNLTAWKRYFPQSVEIIVDPDPTHYYRRPKALLLQLAQKAATFLKKREKAADYAERLHRYVHGEKAKYPAKTYFRDGADVVIAYTMDLCTEMAVHIRADKKYVFFHSSDPAFHRDIAESCFPYFDQIIAVGNKVGAMLRESYPQFREKVAVLRNYVSAADIREKAAADAVGLAPYAGRTVLSSVIRVDKEKGANLIVGAAARLKREEIPFVWYIVGDGGTRDQVEQQIAEEGLSEEIIITGFRDNPYPYIENSDIYVHPAYEESFGLSILEARILGKAVVSTDTMGAREVLRDGEGGVLTAITAEALAEGILQLLRDPQRKLYYESTSGWNDQEEFEAYQKGWNTILNGGML